MILGMQLAGTWIAEAYLEGNVFGLVDAPIVAGHLHEPAHCLGDAGPGTCGFPFSQLCVVMWAVLRQHQARFIARAAGFAMRLTAQPPWSRRGLLSMAHGADLIDPVDDPGLLRTRPCSPVRE